MTALRRTALGVGAALVLAILVAGPVAAAQTHPGPLPGNAATALDAVLACERREGGWMYVCEQGVSVWGATKVVNIAAQVSGWLGLEPWDLVVLRSPGTPAAGELLLDAHARSGDPRALAAARRAGDLLINLQLPSGGWFSEMPVHGDQLVWWFPTFVPGATLDDDVTSGATRFLLSLWQQTGDERYRAAAERGLDLLLMAQLPSGAWPLTWRPPWRRAITASFEDLPSLNDAATTAVIETLIVAGRLLERDDLLAAARRGGEWILAAQGEAPHAGWAQQYDEGGKPTAGRSFEPIALASWESRHALEALDALAGATGDRHFCDGVAAGVTWLRATALGPSCWARLYSLDADAPVYVNRRGERVASEAQAKRPYRWTGDFGIPAFLGRFADPPTDTPWRVAGDAGVCPGDYRWDAPRPESPNPRVRIGLAATLLAELEPARPAACKG